MSFGTIPCQICGRTHYSDPARGPMPLEVCWTHGAEQFLCKKCLFAWWKILTADDMVKHAAPAKR